MYMTSRKGGSTKPGTCRHSRGKKRIQMRRWTLWITFALFGILLFTSWHPRSHISLPGEDKTTVKPIAISEPQKVLPDKYDPELFELEGSFDGSAIRRHCDSVEWREGLYFDCSNNSGGLGNMRSFILSCIRYAIDAGAGIVMPTIRERKADNLGDLFSDIHRPLGYMFDEVFFKQALQDSCPQLIIIQHRNSMPNAENKTFVKDIEIKTMGNKLTNDQGRRGFDANRWAGTFREDLDWWLVTSFGKSPSVANPLVMTLKWAHMFTWPIWLDGPMFANTFGRLLKLNPEIMTLASSVLKEMQKVSPEATAPASENSPLMNYMGVHLRLESDSLGWWPKESYQIDSYVDRAKEINLRPALIYLASGSPIGFEHFSANASTHLNARTVTKETLLKGKELGRLKALHWDQQGLVDYLVLLRSKYFAGVMQSSFSQNLAVRRHLLQQGTETLIWRGYQDKWSYLCGHRKRYNDDWLFFSHETMWP